MYIDDESTSNSARCWFCHQVRMSGAKWELMVWRQRVRVEPVTGLVAFLWLAGVLRTTHVCHTNTSDDCNRPVFTL